MAITKAKEAPKKFVKSLAVAYISNNYITFEDLADKCNMTSRMISNILYRGIAEAILDFDTAKSVYTKVVYFREKGMYIRKQRWDKAFDERKIFEQRRKKISENHQRVKAEIEAEIEEIKHKLSSFDSYYTDEVDAPTKQDLENRLFKLQRTLCLVG